MKGLAQLQTGKHYKHLFCALNSVNSNRARCVLFYVVCSSASHCFGVLGVPHLWTFHSLYQFLWISPLIILSRLFYHQEAKRTPLKGLIYRNFKLPISHYWVECFGNSWTCEGTYFRKSFSICYALSFAAFTLSHKDCCNH